MDSIVQQRAKITDFFEVIGKNGIYDFDRDLTWEEGCSRK